MPIPTPQPSDNTAIFLIVLFLVGLCARYWATAIKLIAVVMIALAVVGFITGLHTIQHMTQHVTK